MIKFKWPFYFVRYTKKLPTWQVANARLCLISIRPDKYNDKGLLEHEKCHVRQWWALSSLVLTCGSLLYFLGDDYALNLVGLLLVMLSPSAHGLLYVTFRSYRMWAEVKAFKAQIKAGDYADTRFLVSAIMNPKYRFSLTEEKAESLLGLDNKVL